MVAIVQIYIDCFFLVKKHYEKSSHGGNILAIAMNPNE